MARLALILVGVVIGMGGMALAQPQSNGEHAKIVATYDLKEKMDGKDAAGTIVEVTIGPGQAGIPHRHPGPAFVYVVEGTYELGVDQQPTKTFKAGETFQEPSGCFHRVSRNPASSGTTRLIAFVLHPRGVKEIVIPADH